MSEKRREWTVVVDELVATREEADRLRELVIATLLEVGQRPRTTTVESWMYRQNTERLTDQSGEGALVRVSTLPHRLLPGPRRRPARPGEPGYEGKPRP
jgi:hypothetical protein